jgi:hypothetical protein
VEPILFRYPEQLFATRILVGLYDSRQTASHDLAHSGIRWSG